MRWRVLRNLGVVYRMHNAKTPGGGGGEEDIAVRELHDSSG